MPKYTKIHAAFNRGSVGVTSMVRGPVCASSPQVHDANNSYCFQGPCWGPMRLLHQHQAHGRQALWSIVITTALSGKPPPMTLPPRAGFTGLLENREKLSSLGKHQQSQTWTRIQRACPLQAQRNTIHFQGF